GHARPGHARTVKCYNCNGNGHIAQNCTLPKRPQNSEYFKDKMLLMQAQENEVALDAEQLLFLAGGLDNAFDDDVDEQPVQDLALNVDNVFQAEDCDAFDSDVDEAPTAQTMFMANLSSADPITDEARPSYDLDILSEYVKDNDVSVVHSNASSVSNDTFMMIYDDMCEPIAPSVSNSSRNAVVKNSLTAELATYREQVELYERQAKFELTEHEQKINEQLRLVISDRCSKHMIGDRSRLLNFVKKFIGTVRFENDHFGAIMGYGDNVVGESVISRVYYVEGLGHNLFFVGQLYDPDLEVAFKKHSCYVRDTNGVNLIKGSRETNSYTISVEDMMKSSLICLLSKASKNKSWLWHRRLNHLNFSTINDLARKDLVR
nr:integrase, catalytic region, zinc finger, CCHC-type, peptidase aspartic, catalytic [Tanacetum cinerariifolium]